MAGRVPITVTVNGQLHAGDVEPRQLLVHFLRDTLGLTGTHVGCDTSNCGACTVHLDGDAVKSCTVLAVQADGAEVTTIEGMGSEGDLHPMQEAFWENHGLQCGYCTPGMIMAGADLIAKNPSPTEEEVREALAGNLCRCTGYHNIVKAVLSAGGPGGEAVSVTEEPQTNGKWVGQALRRKEDPRMITGRGRYVDDMVVPGMLYMAVVRSPEAHAKIVSIDASGAARAARRASASSPARTSTSPPACRWPGCRRASRSRRPSTGRSPRARSSTSARASRSCSATTSTASSTPPSRCSSSTTRCRSSSIPRRRSTTPRRSSTPTSAPTRSHEWSIGGGDMDAAWAEADVVIERRIVNHRTAGTPIEPRALHRRLPRRPAHAAPHEPEPAPHPPVHGRRARDGRGPHPRDRAGRRRRLRREDHPLPGGDPRGVGVAQARPPGQVDGDAQRAHELDRSTAATRSTS